MAGGCRLMSQRWMWSEEVALMRKPCGLVERKKINKINKFIYSLIEHN